MFLSPAFTCSGHKIGNEAYLYYVCKIIVNYSPEITGFEFIEAKEKKMRGHHFRAYTPAELWAYRKHYVYFNYNTNHTGSTNVGACVVHFYLPRTGT